MLFVFNRPACIQSVPRNMALSRQIEGSLCSWNNLRHLNVNLMLEVKLENTTSLGISKMWSAYFMLSILPEIKKNSESKTKECANFKFEVKSSVK